MGLIAIDNAYLAKHKHVLEVYENVCSFSLLLSYIGSLHFNTTTGNKRKRRIIPANITVRVALLFRK